MMILGSILASTLSLSLSLSLCNQSDGVHAHASVNADTAELVGEHIISKMIGLSADEYSGKQIHHQSRWGSNSG